MSEWVTGRTESDVDAAKALMAEIRNNIRTDSTWSLDNLTLSQKITINTGMLNSEVISRIWNDTLTLKENLEDNGYYPKDIKQPFVYDETRPESLREGYEQFLINAQNMRVAFFVLSSTPLAPDYVYGFSEMNQIETIFRDIENEWYVMNANIRECGTFECGG
jgi:hypothetical protein